ncbi:flagellar hook-associated protein FlgL [bacterium]|nr:flagellar hook-associated protein FlgL [bacterium]
MRISDQMRVRSLLYQLENHLDSVSKYQSQLSTGKRIEEPSDDAFGAGKALRYRHGIKMNEQHVRNAEDGMGRMQYSDGILQSITNLMNQAMSLAVAADNDTLTAADRQVIANEVDQLLEDLVSKANTQYNGKYLFGGFNDNAEAFTVTRDGQGLITAVSANPDGIDQEIKREIGVGLKETVNIGGTLLFQPDGEGAESDLFRKLITLRDGCINNDPDAIGPQIDAIQDGIDQISYHSSTLGAKVNFFQRQLEQLGMDAVNYTDSLSNVEDADLIETVMMYEQEQAAYEAALASGATIIQMSLINFMG